MAKPRAAAAANPPPTIAWAEQQLLAHAPPAALLDAANWSVFRIAEASLALVGEWRAYGMEKRDLDPARVRVTLGEMLSAMVQLADAVDLPLADIVTAQVERMQREPTRRRKGALAVPRRAGNPPAVSSPPTEELMSDTGAPIASPRQRQRKQPALPVIGSQVALDTASEVPMRRRRQVIPPVASAPPTPARRGRPPKVVVQPSLLGEEHAPPPSPKRARATRATPTQ